jgi:hypothetical protein
MPPPPKVPIAPVFVSDPNAQSIRIPVSIYATEGAQIVDTFALVDSGATRSFIDRDLMQKRKIPMLRLPRPLRAQTLTERIIVVALSGTRFRSSYGSVMPRKGGSSLSSTVERRT